MSSLTYLFVIVHIAAAIATVTVWGAMRLTTPTVLPPGSSARNWAARLLHVTALLGAASVGSGWGEHLAARIVAVTGYAVAATVGEAIALPAERRLRRGVATTSDGPRFTRAVDVVLVALAVIVAAMIAQY